MRRASQGPIMLPASMPAPSGMTAVQSTGPKMMKVSADTTDAAPMSMFFRALAVAI
jgi:hypothetical protein